MQKMPPSGKRSSVLLRPQEPLAQDTTIITPRTRNPLQLVKDVAAALLALQCLHAEPRLGASPSQPLVTRLPRQSQARHPLLLGAHGSSLPHPCRILFYRAFCSRLRDRRSCCLRPPLSITAPFTRPCPRHGEPELAALPRRLLHFLHHLKPTMRPRGHRRFVLCLVRNPNQSLSMHGFRLFFVVFLPITCVIFSSCLTFVPYRRLHLTLGSPNFALRRIHLRTIPMLKPSTPLRSLAMMSPKKNVIIRC